MRLPSEHRLRSALCHWLCAGVLIVGFATPWSALAEDGKELFEAKCAKCHGTDGKADTPAGKAMKAAVLAGANLTAEQVTAEIRENPKHKALSGMSDTDLAAIVEYVVTLSGGS